MIKRILLTLILLCCICSTGVSAYTVNLNTGEVTAQDTVIKVIPPGGAGSTELNLAKGEVTFNKVTMDGDSNAVLRDATILSQSWVEGLQDTTFDGTYFVTTFKTVGITTPRTKMGRCTAPTL